MNRICFKDAVSNPCKNTIKIYKYWFDFSNININTNINIHIFININIGSNIYERQISISISISIFWNSRFQYQYQYRYDQYIGFSIFFNILSHLCSAPYHLSHYQNFGMVLKLLPCQNKSNSIGRKNLGWDNLGP